MPESRNVPLVPVIFSQELSNNVTFTTMFSAPNLTFPVALDLTVGHLNAPTYLTEFKQKRENRLIF